MFFLVITHLLIVCDIRFLTFQNQNIRFIAFKWRKVFFFVLLFLIVKKGKTLIFEKAINLFLWGNHIFERGFRELNSCSSLLLLSSSVVLWLFAYRSLVHFLHFMHYSEINLWRERLKKSISKLLLHHYGMMLHLLGNILLNCNDSLCFLSIVTTTCISHFVNL